MGHNVLREGGVIEDTQNIGGVVGRGHSPYAHIAFHVILFDFVVAYVNGPRVF